MAVGAVSSSDALKCDAEVGQSGNDDKACLLKSPSLAAGATLQRLGAGACAREEFFRPDPTSPTLKTLKYQNAISKKESIVDASGKGTAAKLTSWTQECTKICDGDAQCFAVTVGIRQR